MREAAVPIETMRTVVEADPATARKVLHELLESRAERAAREQAALAAVLAALDEAGDSSGADGASAVVRLEGPVLAAALRQVRPAADGDPVSPLSSVLVDVTPDGIDVVATNRFWMAVRTLPNPSNGSANDPASSSARVVLPLPAVAGLVAALDAAGQVEMTLSRERLLVARQSYAARDVAYPAHRIVLDGLDEPRTTAVLDAGALRAAIEGAARAEVDLELALDGATVGGTPVGGTVTGEPLALRMGSALLLRALGACLGPEVVVAAASRSQAVRLRSPYQAGFHALVMPIRSE
jgi:DNA polymerase III sliding clamp (beta) subunit (PCNA family)